MLEIGGGNGFQARTLSGWGLDVTAIDVEASQTYFSVQAYDGRTIPAESNAFDHVFSSNVLEHVRDLGALNDEIRRVLKPGGTAIHILPSSTWRLWTSLAHYAYIVKFLITRKHTIPTHSAAPATSRNWTHLAKRALLAGPHGEFSSAFAELYGFSRPRWAKVFARDGFEVVHQGTNGLFYTGYGLLPRLSLERRRALAAILGSSCNVFVCRDERSNI